MTDIRSSNGAVSDGPRPRFRWLLFVAAISLVLLSVALRVWFSKSDRESFSQHTESSSLQSPLEPASGRDRDFQPGPLTIATWNINYNNHDLTEVSRMLRASKADVVCLQESTEQSETWLKRELADLYPSQFVAGHSGNFFAEGFMVLSRIPILNPRFVPPARTYFGHVVFESSHAGQSVTVISVHLTPFTTRGARTVPQLISVLGQTEVDHREEVHAVLNDEPQDRPLTIVGDFNSPSHGVAPTTLTGRGLTDLFAELHSDPDQTQKSWDFRLPNGLRATWRIDYMFYSPHFKPLAAKLEHCQSSDHHLLIGKFEFEALKQSVPDLPGSRTGGR